MSKSCKDILDLIPMYIDNVLEDDIDNKVREHLKTCENCRYELTLASRISDGLRNLPDVPLSADFHKNLVEKAKEQQTKKRARRIVLFKRGGAGVAAAAVVALSVVSFANLNKADTDISEQAPIFSATPTPDTSVPEENTKTTQTNTDYTARIETYERTEPTTAPQAEAEPATITDNKASSGGGGSAAVIVPTAPATTEETLGVDAAVMCDDMSYMKAVITLNDTNRDAVMEILSSYEKDETGYRVPDINRVMRKIAELGADITAESCDLEENYIIVK